jgi:hypothetical protein
VRRALHRAGVASRDGRFPSAAVTAAVGLSEDSQGRP